MKFTYILLLALITILLSACTNEESREESGSVSDGEASSENNALEHGVTEQNQDQGDVGFEVMGNNIEEAQHIPAKEKKAILTAFETYMEAFNEEDIKKYMSVIASEPEGFNYQEEEIAVKNAFAQYDVIRTAEDVTVIKYDKSQAQVFAALSISLIETATGAQLNRSGRQVTVFDKEDGHWRVTSVYFIGNATQ